MPQTHPSPPRVRFINSASPADILGFSYRTAESVPPRSAKGCTNVSTKPHSARATRSVEALQHTRQKRGFDRNPPTPNRSPLSPQSESSSLGHFDRSSHRRCLSLGSSSQPKPTSTYCRFSPSTIPRQCQSRSRPLHPFSPLKSRRSDQDRCVESVGLVDREDSRGDRPRMGWSSRRECTAWEERRGKRNRVESGRGLTGNAEDQESGIVSCSRQFHKRLQQ